MDQFITALSSPVRKVITVEIPYENYKIRIIVSNNEDRILHEEDVSIMYKEPGKNYYVDVTSRFVTKFSEYKKIKPTGVNLITLCGFLYNHINEEK